MPARHPDRILRRSDLLRLAAAWSLPGALPVAAQPDPGLLTRPIPASGEALPVVGLGSWITFNVGNDPVARERCTQVMRDFFAAGGRMIDSSPMYGSSQPVIGAALEQLRPGARLFAADKVWTSGNGTAQVAQSRQLWRVPRFDLLQVHNLLAWQQQLPRLWLWLLRQAWTACDGAGAGVDPAARVGQALLAAALLFPLLAPAWGRPPAQSEWFGLMPDPTVLATLGLLLWLRRGLALLVVPLLWCAVTGATLWTLGAGDWFLLPLAGSLALAAALWQKLAAA